MVFGCIGTQNRQDNTYRLMLGYVRVSFTWFSAFLRQCVMFCCVVSFVCGLLMVLFCCVFRVCNRTLFGLAVVWRLREGRVRVIVFLFEYCCTRLFCKTFLHIRLLRVSSCGVRLQRNAEQARKHRRADSLIRTRQLHIVSCINQDMWNSCCRVVRSLGRIALVTYLVFGSEFWFDFSGRV